jgi:hypothetical protein
MERLVRMLLSLGSAGAFSNAREMVDQRAREDWLVDGLVARLDQRGALTSSPAEHVDAGAPTTPIAVAG